MSLFDEPGQEARVVHPPCALCGQEAPWAIWGQRLCIPHGVDLMELPAYLAALKGDQTQGLDAKATDFVRRWVAKQQQDERGAA